MEQILLNLLHGFIVGLAVSIPLGPAGLFSIQRTLSKGRLSGFMAGMGAACSDTLYAALTLLSLAFIQSFIDTNQTWLLIIGGIIVAGAGVVIFFHNPIRQLRSHHATKRYWGDFLAGFGMTVSNPGALLIIIAAFTIVGVSHDSAMTAIGISSILGGVLLGSTAWWHALSTTLNIFRRRFRLRTLITINRISGVAIGALGILSLLKGIWQFLRPLLRV